MLFSLFDNLITKPKLVEEVSFQQNFEIKVNGEDVPVKIMLEKRFNNRVTVNKNGILLRISERQGKDEQKKQIDLLLKWAKDKLGDKPELLDNLPQRKYVNGEILKVGAYEFVISIHHHDSPKSSAKIFRNNIVISLAKGLSADAAENTCSYLVAKCLSKFFLPIVTARLQELNDRFFKKTINSVKMKYATSFWGHCSHNGNLVISVRLMFAPARTIDYVLIHELAHLIHHDHSRNFWKVVEQVMPDYRNHEKVLTANNLKYYL